MSLFNGPLLVSLPGAELGMALSGAVCAPHEVLAAAISPELRAALHLLRGAAAAAGVDVRCLARPEMFTAGVAAQRLRAAVPGASHVCLSDGGAIGLLAGFDTHVFLYARAGRAAAAASLALHRRAPELVLGLRGQVNSAFVLGGGAHRLRPPPLFLAARAPPEQPRATLLAFLFNRHSAEDSANRIAAAGPVAPDSLTGFTSLCYMPLNEVALDDRGFARLVAQAVLRSCFAPDALLVLRLPPVRGDAAGLAARIAAILPALRDSGVVLPGASPGNVLLATDDLEESHPLFDRFAPHVQVHESFDFWRHSAAFYGRAARVTVFGADSGEAGFLPFDVRDVYGPKAVRRWSLATTDA